jgi:hypothetical protein
MTSDLSKLDLLVIQIDGLHIGEGFLAVLNSHLGKGSVYTGGAALRGWENSMRVLTTWMYFDEAQIAGAKLGRRRIRRGREEESDYGVGVAWFAGDTTSITSISNLKAFRPLRGERGEELNEERLRDLVDLFLLDADEFEFDRPERSLKNTDLVDYILSQPIIIERSPPIGVTLKGLITATNLPIWIGTYMGWSVVPDHSVLLFITVPCLLAKSRP